MFNCFLRQKYPLTFNKTLSDYCKNSTNEYIRKLTERYNSEKKPKIKLKLNDYYDDDNPQFNYYGFFLFLSIFTITVHIYKRLK
jgi:hypothetical protein